MTDALQAADLMLFQALTPWHSPRLDQVMSWISASGIAGMIWILLSAVACLQARHRAAACRVLLTIGLAYVVVDGVLKPLVARPRPSVEATDPPREVPPLPRTFSFPSGHAASTVGAAVAISRIWPAGRAVWWALALLIGYSRIYLAHHYPLDVAGGAVVGVAVAMWVLGGRHPATYASTLDWPLPDDVKLSP